MSTIVNAGLFGFGCVGQGFYELASRLPEKPFRIKRIGVKHREKKRSISPELFSYEPEEILNDPDINLIVEVIDNADEAFEIVSSALRLGKTVVTANKKMLGEKLPQLLYLAETHRGKLLYEASVCGNIPIIRTLEAYYRNIPVKKIEGIVNGSSNYILSRMHRENLAYQTALWLAQDQGFAESNPTLDVEGFDAQSKLSILARHAFGRHLPVEEIVRVGISNILEQDIRFAADQGYRIKLVASAEKHGDRITGSVLPQLRPSPDPLFNVENEDNSVVIETAFGIRQQYFGKGAGSHPTGEAVLADVLDALQGYSYASRPSVQGSSAPEPDSDALTRVYVRSEDPEALRRIPFKAIEEQHSSSRFNYLIGQVPRDILNRELRADNRDLFVAVIPERVSEQVLLAA